MKNKQKQPIGIVVGASSGMGHEVARLLLEEGWRLGLAARRTAPLEQLARQFPEQVMVSQIDVCEPDADRRLVALTDQMGAPIDLYLHCAGIGKQNPELHADIEIATVETNCLGFTRCVDAMFAHMAQQGGGHIAAISSIAGTKGLGPAPSYSATKAFQNTYIQALEQLSNSRRLGIRFTDIRPGFVDTPLLNTGDYNYPMLMPLDKTARAIVRAIKKRRHVVVIDRRFRLLTALWRLVPNCLWRRIKLTK